jgi:DNA-binding transcriptional regulator YiaG
MNAPDMLAINAAEVREYREMHGLSTQALCDILEIDTSTLWRWESCAVPVPKVVLLWMRASNENRALSILVQTQPSV